MSFLPRDPRLAPSGNRTFWMSVWIIEWGLIFALLDTIAGFLSVLCFKTPASEVVQVVSAPMGILTLLGAWSQFMYKGKSVARAGQGSDAPPTPGGSP